MKADKELLLQEGEDTIQEYETSLGFSSLPADLSLSVLQEISRNRGLSPQQLRTWLAKLGVSTTRLDTKDSSMAVFFTLFIEKGRYSRDKLGVLAVLLGEGSSECKAGALFRLLCKGGIMTRSELESLVETCYSLACHQIPHFAETEIILLRDIPALKKLQKYTERISKFQERIKEKLEKLLLSPELDDYTELQFVEALQTKAAVLISSQKLRDYAQSYCAKLTWKDAHNKKPQASKVALRSNPFRQQKHTSMTMPPRVQGWS